MKLHRPSRRDRAMNVFEVLIVIATLMLLVAFVLPVLMRPRISHSSRIGCVNNLKQVGLAYRIWAQDNNDHYPMQVSITNGGAMELAATGNVVAVFQVMSNELSTPKILSCPSDALHEYANNFTSLTATNISYFVGLDIDTNYSPNLILSGDANLALRGASAKSGLFSFASNAPVSWTVARHSGSGNLGLNDGSVVQTTSHTLQTYFNDTGLATNRLAIP
jgi:hypothetical protein